jgi:hypothetical protein
MKILSVTYGTSNQSIDVTEKFCDTFYKNNEIYIPMHINFNGIFDDPFFREYKHLTITIEFGEDNIQKYIVPEIRTPFGMRM